MFEATHEYPEKPRQLRDRSFAGRAAAVAGRTVDRQGEPFGSDEVASFSSITTRP
jgi:hypothetical protein